MIAKPYFKKFKLYFQICIIVIGLQIEESFSKSFSNPNSQNENDLIYNLNKALDQTVSSSSDLNCCDETFIINSETQSEGYLKAPPFYEEINEAKNMKNTIECLYKFYGRPNERIQLFYEDFDLYYPYDINRFNKIEYADSICIKFYEKDQQSINKKNKNTHGNKLMMTTQNNEIISLDNHHYDICNCINVSFIPRQIMSASNYLQVRFKTVQRTSDNLNPNRGYLIRYKFTTNFGIDTADAGIFDPNDGCKIYYRGNQKREGYFSSPNYPGLYPRDVECHYYFIGEKDQKVQLTFQTFDVEGVEQCTADTKSDYVELSNFQNRDRYFSRFCGANKPFSIISDASFFHVTFYSNNLFDGKGFQASYHFINLYSKDSSKDSNRETRKNLHNQQKLNMASASSSSSSSSSVFISSYFKSINIVNRFSILMIIADYIVINFYHI